MRQIYTLILLITAIGLSAQNATLDADNGVKLGDNTTTTEDGTMRYTGSDFEGLNSGVWNSLTSPWIQSGTKIYYQPAFVGIGLTNPTSKLHVGGDGNNIITNEFKTSSNFSRLRLTSNLTGEFLNFSQFGNTLTGSYADGTLYAGASTIMAGSASTRMVLGTNGSSPLFLLTEGTTRLAIRDDGHVGIGAKNYKRKVTISDIDDPTLIIGTPTVNAAKGGAIYLDENIDVPELCGMGFEYDGNSNQMHIVGGCNDPILDTITTISRDGEWAIGTQEFADGYLVSVGGKIICEELQVQLETAWPDYVFEDDYALISLSDLEKFIEINGHLPNIPSAEIVEKEGIATGEMQTKMMEKIEELTLYIIKHDKEKNDLIQRLENLEKEVSLLKSSK